ncbi:CocE/NonD family hydrolase [Nitrincola alkalilacustris]|uniref:CocE/NonD family hydrolase n=1 Tax=Nitrincola alkalilacustris TaxID=1571224 RepID=UPI0014566D4E|nr:CocE/NonD family hydrolase [Nitrincola alkalilacustris]
MCPLDTLQEPFTIHDPIWIVMPDGVRLAARLWLPDKTRNSAQVPTIFEYLPYRRRDGTLLRDEVNHSWFARQGYACLRVDIRGNGDSEGFMEDEYTPIELDDGVNVIEWIAQQPWSNGSVGMIGISWGGFNALQIAELAPEALKAIIPICFTDDRYADDIHYMGGCLLTENLGWSSQMFAYSSRPPDPEIVGKHWRQIWRDRLEHQPLLIETWLQHQTRDSFWKHGSVCENYANVKAAVLAVGGWADAYSNAVPRVLSELSSPARGIVGPWAHKYPHVAYPEPRIDFLNECKRWFDHWLLGIENDVEKEPQFQFYIMSSIPPSRRIDYRPGHWAAEQSWPSPRISEKIRYLCRDGLSEVAEQGTDQLTVSPTQTVGMAGQRFCPGMRDLYEMADDQEIDDLYSLTFDTEALSQPMDLVGAASVDLTFTPDQASGFVVVRLCDVRPDNSVAFITMGIHNLTHDPSHANIKYMTPGTPHRVSIKLNDIAYCLPVGHKLRLALSTAYWPMVWPSANPLSLRISLKDSILKIPTRSSYIVDKPVMKFRDQPPSPARTTIRSEGSDRLIHYLSDGTQVMTLLTDGGKERLTSTGIETGRKIKETYSLNPDNPLSAKMEAEWEYEVGRGRWQTRTVTWSQLTSDAEKFYIKARLQAFEGDQLFFEKEWESSILRNGL